MKTRLQDHIDKMELLRPDLVTNRTELPSKTLQSVIKDMKEREKKGLQEYGTTVDRQDYTLLMWLKELYQEHLDAAIYCKRTIMLIEESFKEFQK
jgi:hypothetical protein